MRHAGLQFASDPGSSAKVEADLPPHASPAAEYRRAARRLRGQWRGRPERLQTSLRNLARRTDAAAAAAAKPPPPPELVETSEVRDVLALAGGGGHDLSRTQVRWFVGEVGASADGPLLRYSTRLSLLRTADRLGIGRFHANLIIAAVLHTRQPTTVTPVDEASTTPPRWLMLAGKVAMVVLVQGTIALAAWKILHP